MERKSYCSWCFELTTHNLVAKGKLTRKIYKCSRCDRRTVKCRYCENMAQAKLSKETIKQSYDFVDSSYLRKLNARYWNNELCAVHNGGIGSFRNLGKSIEDITDYHELKDRDCRDILKIGKITIGTIAGATVIGPAFYLTAPAIGGSLGTTFGLTGAAATSKGLALIGGGSIAAGGLGMAGGTFVVTALGSGLGGVGGGIISYSYLNDIKGFKIIKEGEDNLHGIIFIDGFLTEDESLPFNDWTEGLSINKANSSYYYVSWESKTLKKIGVMVLSNLSKMALKQLIYSSAKKASKLIDKRLGPLNYIMLAYIFVNNPWYKAMVISQKTGALLADLIARTENRTYTLIGHSLGCRVIQQALYALSTKEKKYIVDVHLLGGAVGNDGKVWESCANAVQNKIHNYYSENDYVLKGLYRASTLFTNQPIGSVPIKSEINTIVNHDVSQYVSGHTQYKNNLHQFFVG